MAKNDAILIAQLGCTDMRRTMYVIKQQIELIQNETHRNEMLLAYQRIHEATYELVAVLARYEVNHG